MSGEIDEIGYNTFSGKPYLEPEFVEALRAYLEPRLQKRPGNKSHLFEFARERPELARAFIDRFLKSEMKEVAYRAVSHDDPSPVLIIIHVCSIRMHTEETAESLVGWHQDANLFNGHYGFTVWTPLSDTGVRSRSLSFVDTRGYGREQYEVLRQAFLFRAKRDALTAASPRMETDEELRAFLPVDATFVTPSVEAGGCLGFDSYIFHRSQALEDARPRISVEMRITTRDRALKGNIPVGLWQMPDGDLMIEQLSVAGRIRKALRFGQQFSAVPAG